MRKIKRFSGLLITVLLTVLLTLPVMAEVNNDYIVNSQEEGYIIATNDVSHCYVIIEDCAGLFEADELNYLIPYLNDCALEGEVALVTIDYNDVGSAYDYARRWYAENFGSNTSGIVFLIDMDNRELRMYSEGSYSYILNTGKQNIITDNIYRYATNGDYVTCAERGFTQMADVLSGKKIASPMKYLSNACLAILIALIVNYFIVVKASKTAVPMRGELRKGLKSRYSFTNKNAVYTHTTKEYSPRSSSSGGSGGGGGGHSSSGGHSF